MTEPSTSPPPHGPEPPFPVIDGCLSLGGVALSELRQRLGRTPFYAYDREHISARVRELRAALPAGIELHYAIKANPMAALVDHLARLVDGFDVASAGELQRALDSGMSPERISFAGPGKRTEELAMALAAGVTLHLESPTELERLIALAEITGRTARVAVRVNPDFELKTSGMKMSGGPKPFGVDAEAVPALLARIGESGLDFRGFHLFCGSQNLSAPAIVEAQRQSIALACRLADAAPAPVRLLNIGGGFGIPYFPGERALDLAPIAKGLAEGLETVRAALPEASLVLELGRYLVGEAGVYVAEVLDRKVSRGEVFLVTDGGLHHHLAASGNFGQVIRKNYPVVIANRMDSAERERVSVVGPLCTPLDVLARHLELPRAEIGDLVAVLQSGAYGLSASPRAFLGHPDALEVLV